jgi:hypothetical protein
MVKRYDMREFDHSIEIYEDGSMVSYDDYAALAERCERLEVALRMARDHLLMLYPTAEGDDFLVDTVVAALSPSSGGGDE